MNNLTKEQINLLLQVDQQTADTLFDLGETTMYHRIRNDLWSLARDAGLKLNLDQLQFVFHKKATWHFGRQPQ